MQANREFLPRMETRIHGLRTLAPLCYRRFAGAIADVWSVRGEEGGGGFYIAPDPRIVILLGKQPPPVMMRIGGDLAEYRGIQAFYMPPGMPLWSRIEADHEKSHLDFHMESSALHQRLAAADVRADLTRPRLLGPSDKLADLGRLASDEVRKPSRGDMLIDALLSATLAEIFATQAGAENDGPCTASGGLSARRFAAVERHLHENLSRHVPLAEMARAAGLSESRFSHCFKQSQNETPQRWQSRVRLKAAQDMMRDPARSLADIAYATGFADQAHLSRVFRAANGMPPSVWRRSNFQES
ncbi:AraC family transcriptional regulator [Paracoccus sp. PS-1]|uniref:AraC family transcriptional regulator n=1 Tax=unclassified Paracoccus (in: a-proteobacteria) TaxID=2688777 RepID=UPI00049018B8|nr:MULTISPECIES: AraC family transcriptional regulator [unclassified Paracoccus (in: a-proteobacteria)]MDQ7263944.1 AraC family transcriptional regulator [Paracoccus sp. PS1]